MRKTGKGFTLIELLVVIAIIAVLAAILFPVFTKAKQAAQASNCSNNLKQLSGALAMYLDSWDGAFPSYPYDYSKTQYDENGQLWNGLIEVGRGQQNYTRTTSIMSILDDYTKNRNVWKCPADTLCSPDVVVGKRWSSYPYRFFIAYATHPWLHDWYKSSFGAPPFKLSRFPVPSRTFVFNERFTFHDDKTKTTATNAENVLMQKDGKMIMGFAFLDGHVARYTLDRLVWFNEKYGVYDYAWPDPKWDGRFVDLKP